MSPYYKALYNIISPPDFLFSKEGDAVLIKIRNDLWMCALRSNLFIWCGYLITSRKFHNAYYNVHVHGGWTLEEEGVAVNIKSIFPDANLDPNISWCTLGFDCGHGGDATFDLGPGKTPELRATHYTKYRTLPYVLYNLYQAGLTYISFDGLVELTEGSDIDKGHALLCMAFDDSLKTQPNENILYITDWATTYDLDTIVGYVQAFLEDNTKKEANFMQYLKNELHILSYVSKDHDVTFEFRKYMNPFILGALAKCFNEKRGQAQPYVNEIEIFNEFLTNVTPYKPLEVIQRMLRQANIYALDVYTTILAHYFVGRLVRGNILNFEDKE